MFLVQGCGEMRRAFLCLTLVFCGVYSENLNGSECQEDYTCELSPSTVQNIEYITVRLNSSTCLEVYCEDHNDFRLSVAAMAQTFVRTANVSVHKDDVAVLDIGRCQTSCVEFTFGLDVDVSGEQQFTSFILQRMWQKLARQYFPNALLDPPKFPMPEWVIPLILMFAVIICFSIILYLLRKLAFWQKGLNDKKLKSRDSQMVNIVEDDTRRDSLRPHSLQPVSNLGESEYPYYEPSVIGANQRGSGSGYPITVNRDSLFAAAERNSSHPVPNRPQSYINT